MDEAPAEGGPVCAFCDQPGVALCRRCGRYYCPMHGAELCSVCLDPVSALPSERLYQAALLILLVAAALGLWFLLARPRLPGEYAPVAGHALLVEPSIKHLPAGLSFEAARA